MGYFPIYNVWTSGFVASGYLRTSRPGHLPPSSVDGRMSASLVGALRSTGDSGLNARSKAADFLTLRPRP